MRIDKTVLVSLRDEDLTDWGARPCRWPWSSSADSAQIWPGAVL
jgi:hypothetical protein